MIVKHPRGSLYWAEITANNETKIRPVVVVSNDLNNIFSNRVTVICATTAVIEKPQPTHIPIKIHDKQSTLLCESIHTISKEQLKGYIGLLTGKIMNDINERLTSALDIDAEIDRKLSEPHG